jgi:hypothetical protein
MEEGSNEASEILLGITDSDNDFGFGMGNRLMRGSARDDAAADGGLDHYCEG